MSDLLNKASLVVIPSGYKEDTVYSVVPSDGSGDLSFTRASNGTRINSAGLVEVCPWNIVEQSETFDSATWTKTGSASITANNTTAPNGTLTADRINVAASTYSGAYQFINQPNGVYANSIYAKAGTFNYLFVLINGSSGYYVWFNLATGTVGSKGANMEGTIESVGDGWYRCTASRILNNDTNNYHQFGFSNAEDFTPSTTGTAYIWGAQTNIGSTAKPYFPTTDRLNVPRLTYQNGGGGCPSLLLEKQSTNLALQSRNFQTTWTNSNVTITANSTTDVYGTTQAQKIEATGSGVHRCAQFLSTTSGSVYALSIDAKKGSTDWVMIRHDNGGSLNYFNLNTGTKGATCDASALIENVGNGWYRLTVFHTAGSSSGPELYVAKGNNHHDFTANGEYIYIDNVQYEQSSYPTSRIPTTSSSATRVADACFKTGISSLIGQTEGVIFYDGVLTGISNLYANLINSEKNVTGSFSIGQRISTGAILCGFFVGGSQIINFDTGTYALGTRTKIAFAYKSGSFALYINGTQLATSSATFTPVENIDDIYIGDETTYFNYKENTQVNQVALFKTRLTNAELASLTTI